MRIVDIQGVNLLKLELNLDFMEQNVFWNKQPNSTHSGNELAVNLIYRGYTSFKQREEILTDSHEDAKGALLCGKFEKLV